MKTSHSSTCRKALQDISAYLDGDLDATACDAIERHARGCADCADVLDGLRKTVGLCRQAAGVTMPDAVRERARDAVRKLLAQSPSSMPGEGSHPPAE
jgi:anti-sigma factor RsiW